MDFSGIPAIDSAVMTFVQTHFHNPVTDAVFPFITTLGEFGAIWIILALLLLLPKKTRRTGVLVLIAMACTLVIGEFVLKNAVCRVRPCNVFTDFPMLIARPTSYSFPSGHTASSFTAATVLALRHRKYGWLAYIPASLIAFSRIFLFVHYFTDILGGILLGCIVAGLTCFAAHKIALRRTATALS